MLSLVQISKSALVQILGDDGVSPNSYACISPNIKIRPKVLEFFQKPYHSQILVNNLLISHNVVLS